VLLLVYNSCPVFSYKFESSLVDELNGAGAKGSFFVNGNNWGCAYDYADELLHAFKSGHLIGISMLLPRATMHILTLSSRAGSHTYRSVHAR
jgi:hypothetical protein